MERADIEHLARLARLRLSVAELDTFSLELPAILNYVSTVTSIAADEADSTPAVGSRHNVFRPDVVTTEPDAHTETLLAALPHRRGRFMQVPKILSTDE